MSRIPLLAGNWKMYKSAAEARRFFAEFKSLALPLPEGREVAFGVPFPALEASVESVFDTPVMIAAQNMYWENEGAFTGEVSGSMIIGSGAEMVILGHSERRQFFGDTNEWVNRKLRAALSCGLKPIVCLGETLVERESSRTFEVLGAQLAEGLAGFKPEELTALVLAYEPVWAIGTGKTATPDQAQEAQAFIRGRLAALMEKQLANSVRILYGGSVKPDNAAGLMAQPDIDGALVGGASLDPVSFAKIVAY